MSAEFKVIKVDPEGSGLDWGGHLGAMIINAKRCYKNCTIIFGIIGNIDDFGPFVIGELEPLNDEACQVLNEVIEKANEFRPRNVLIYSDQYKCNKAMIVGLADVELNGLSFEIKRGIC